MKSVSLTDSERESFRDILGYLNFSSGSVDPRFENDWNKIFELLAKKYSRTPRSAVSRGDSAALSLEPEQRDDSSKQHEGDSKHEDDSSLTKSSVLDASDDDSPEIWRETYSFLKHEREFLSQESDAFRNSERAGFVLDFLFQTLLPRYRQFHADTLFHQKDEFLFNSFFLAKTCELILTLDPPWDEAKKEALIGGILSQMNDFLGYRPVPVLEGREKHEPNPHEWIGAVPLFRKDVGVAFGKYHDLIEKTLEILRETDSVLLRDAWFDPDKLNELALDPRAYDFDHPVNRRPNYNFGTWDPHCIDNDGYYRRFIVHPVTVDCILKRVAEQPAAVQDEYLFEAAAVLAGTILMGSGITGDHVQSHDSSVTLATLMPQIASYRDRFYESLILKVPENLSPRLELEAKQLFQPFGGARQDLNQRLAKCRADQLQRFQLARTYARMGYFESAKNQAEMISVASARFLSQIDCHISEILLLIDLKELEQAAALFPKIEDLLHRGIACGAIPDPWTLLGFSAQYSLFPSIDSTIHDHRLDDLIALMNDLFDLYSRLLKEAAACGNFDLQADVSDRMSNLAGWWDQFGSTEVSNVEGFSGQEVWESAVKVSTALAAWHQLGTAAGDVGFWRRHVERFHSPKAFVLLSEALLERNDSVSVMALLMYWLSMAEEIPLYESSYSFHAVTFRWMEKLWNDHRARRSKNSKRRSVSEPPLSSKEYRQRWDLTMKFLDRMEANAGIYWNTPVLELDESYLDDVQQSETGTAPYPQYSFKNFSDSAQKIFQVSSQNAPKKPKEIKVSPEVVRNLCELFPHQQVEIAALFKENPTLKPEYFLNIRLFLEMFKEYLNQKNEKNKSPEVLEFIHTFEDFLTPDDGEKEFNVVQFLDSLMHPENYMDDEADDSGEKETASESADSFSKEILEYIQGMEKEENFDLNNISLDFHFQGSSDSNSGTTTGNPDDLNESKNSNSNDSSFSNDRSKDTLSSFLDPCYQKDKDPELESFLEILDNMDENDLNSGTKEADSKKDASIDPNSTSPDSLNSSHPLDSNSQSPLKSQDKKNKSDSEDVSLEDETQKRNEDQESDKSSYRTFRNQFGFNFDNDSEAIEDDDLFKDIEFNNDSDVNDDEFEDDEFEDDEFDDDEFEDDEFEDDESEDEDSDEEDDEDEDDRGIDPLYKAAYENMTFRDSAEDGVDDEMIEGFSDSSFAADSELTEEMDRLNDRMAFIFTNTKLWKYAAGKSPLLPNTPWNDLSEQELEEIQYRMRRWLKQSVQYQTELHELLANVSRYHVPKPIGTAESLIEYDQHRGTKEILIDRIIWTIVEVSDTIFFLQTILQDDKPAGQVTSWGQKVLQVASAIFRSDVKRVRLLWGDMLKVLEKDTLLYIPSSRGGNPKAIVDCRCLHQVVLRLFEYAPRLGLLTETFQLLQSVQKMESMRPSLPGAITEFDCIFEAATRSITECIIESSKNWRIRAEGSSFQNVDQALILYLEKTMDILLSCWLSHSQHIRISSVEAILNNAQWEVIKSFVQKYGSDIFTQHFLGFRNLRAILHQGVETFLRSLMKMQRENRELEIGELLVDDLINNRIDLKRASNQLELIFECVAENYSEYIDYNSTTTHSDHGEKLYMLLNMLRVLISYERVSWNLKPVYWVHDTMIRLERLEAATLWEKSIAHKSAPFSEENIKNYQTLSKQYGIWLPSIYERLQQRFVQPLQVARMCGLISKAIQEARLSVPHTAFEELERQVEVFAKTPMGVGFEIPDWLNTLQEEVMSSQIQSSKEESNPQQPQDDAFNPPPVFKQIRMNRAELERQLLYCLDHITFAESYLP